MKHKISIFLQVFNEEKIIDRGVKIIDHLT